MTIDQIKNSDINIEIRVRNQNEYDRVNRILEKHFEGFLLGGFRDDIPHSFGVFKHGGYTDGKSEGNKPLRWKSIAASTFLKHNK